MFVNQTGMGQVLRVPRGTRLIPVPRRGVGQVLRIPVGTRLFDVPRGITPHGSRLLPVPRGLGQCCQLGGDATCPCPANEYGGAWLGQCAACLDPNNLPAGCTSATDPLQIDCQPTLHGSYELPNSPSPCASGYPGWVLSTDGTWTWCGSGPAPAYNPSNAPTSTSTTSLMTPPVASAPASATAPTTAVLSNTSRPGQSFQVGDSWSLQITGAPNSPVSDAATQNGQSLGSTPYGSTDGNGNFSLTGTFTSATAGTWSEAWTVGGVAAPTLNFTVGNPSATVAPSSSISTQPTGATAAAGATSPAAAAGCFAPLGSLGIPDPCLGPIGLTSAAAAFVAILLLSSFMGGRR